MPAPKNIITEFLAIFVTATMASATALAIEGSPAPHQASQEHLYACPTPEEITVALKSMPDGQLKMGAFLLDRTVVATQTDIATGAQAKEVVALQIGNMRIPTKDSLDEPPKQSAGLIRLAHRVWNASALCGFREKEHPAAEFYILHDKNEPQ